VTLNKTSTYDSGGGWDIQMDALSGGGLALRGYGSQPHLSTLDNANVRTTLADYDVSGPFHGGIQQLGNGNYVLFAQTHVGLGRGVDVKLFDASGNPISGTIQPMAEQDNNALSGTFFSVTPTSNGGFAVIWTSDAYGANQIPATGFYGTTSAYQNSDVRIRYYDAAGNPVAASAIASQDVYSINGASTSYHAGTQFSYDAETLSNGSVVYTYHTQVLVGQTAGFAHYQDQITVQVSTGAGNPGTPVKVDQDPYYAGNDGGFAGLDRVSSYAGANVVTLANGGFAVIWQEQSYVADASVWTGKAFDGTDSFVRYFAADGTPTSDAIEFLHRGTALGNISSYVFAEGTPDGRIAVAYVDGIYGVNGTSLNDAYLGIIDNGTLVDVTRVNDDKATSGQTYTVYDLAVEANGAITIEYNDAHATQPNGYAYNHTLISRYVVAPTEAPRNILHDQAGSATALAGTIDHDLFLFDNGGATGRDTITKFGADDLLLTRVKIFDGNNDGIVDFGKDKRLDLFGNAADDVAIRNEAGKAITKLAYEGVLTVDGVDYYAYGLPGADGDNAYHYHLGTAATLM
jgi:hypothetical protein